MKFKEGDIVKYFSDFGPLGKIVTYDPIESEHIWVDWGDSLKPQWHYEHELLLVIDPNDILKDLCD